MAYSSPKEKAKAAIMKSTGIGNTFSGLLSGATTHGLGVSGYDRPANVWELRDRVKERRKKNQPRRPVVNEAARVARNQAAQAERLANKPEPVTTESAQPKKSTTFKKLDSRKGA
jgi:hypothetical protein